MTWLCIGLSWIWWIYLGTHSQMILAQDALGYEALGRSIADKGFFPHYFLDGPNREPVYPLMVAFSMKMGFWYHLPYQPILTILGCVILGLNQLCALRLMQILNIQQHIAAAALLYLGFSPAINNMAFSLYSEIAALPFILPLFLLIYHLARSIENKRMGPSIAFALFIGIAFFLLTLVKASFEIITPLFFIVLYTTLWKNQDHRKIILLCALLSFCAFLLPTQMYKNVNRAINGQYAITNRASWALYGNTARRMQPMDTTRILSGLAYTPGEGVCKHFFDSNTCDFWSYKKSDDLGMVKMTHLRNALQSPEAINQELLKASARHALSNPLQYAAWTILEGIKMFFWESTQIGFVQYPDWLQRIYTHAAFKDLLRLLVSLVTIAAIFFLGWNSLQGKNSLIMNMVGAFILLFISTYSFFFILTRYCLPIAPLYIIVIAYTANILYNNRHAKHQ